MNLLRWLFGPPPLTPEAHMASLGWTFVPTGPNEWEWRKFAPPPDERSIAAQGDSTWIADLSKHGRA